MTDIAIANGSIMLAASVYGVDKSNPILFLHGPRSCKPTLSAGQYCSTIIYRVLKQRTRARKSFNTGIVATLSTACVLSHYAFLVMSRPLFRRLFQGLPVRVPTRIEMSILFNGAWIDCKMIRWRRATSQHVSRDNLGTVSHSRHGTRRASL